MGVFPDIFTEMAVLLLAAGVGALCMRLRQPLMSVIRGRVSKYQI